MVVLPTMLLSAGHHPGDSGASHEDLTEHDIARGICFYMMGEIGRIPSSNQLPVVVVPTDMLSSKIVWVNKYYKLVGGPCFAVEVHVNSFHDGNVRGVSCYHAGIHGGSMQQEMAKAVVASVARPSWPSRGTKTQAESNLKSLGWISKTAMPALLVEIGFITNRTQREFMRSDSGQQALGIRLARGVEDAAVFMHSFTNDDKPGGEAMIRGEFSGKDWREGRAQDGLDDDMTALPLPRGRGGDSDEDTTEAMKLQVFPPGVKVTGEV